jgi:thiol-disulfide isomerase/thioredoxin
MRKVLLILTLCVGMVACSGGKRGSVAENQQPQKDVVEVLFFHGAQSCASCKAIERTTEELLVEYEEAIERGDVVYSKLDLIDHESRAEKYGIIWSSLLVINYDNEGNEQVTNLTDYAYTDVMSDSERLKSRLRTTINNYLTK